MSDDRRRPSRAAPEQTPAERLLHARSADLPGVGRPLSERARRRQAAARAELRERYGADAGGFARAWRAHAAERAASREWTELNALIREHNEWYPIERDLPVDPRTGEWVTAFGRSHLRPLLGEAWALREFPVE